jgi:hypothetical protein
MDSLNEIIKVMLGTGFHGSLLEGETVLAIPLVRICLMDKAM